MGRLRDGASPPRPLRASATRLKVIFLITFGCYGTHLPGDVRGGYDHVRGGEHRFILPNPGLEMYRRCQMRQASYALSATQARGLVRGAIVEVCRFRGWYLFALHVRPSHVHGLVEADAPASRVLSAWKAYATRSLRCFGVDPSDRIIWAHGGNSWRIASHSVRATIRYILECQGDPMEVYCADEWR
jgi:REP element-mobilizing transposase RayT